MPFVLALAGCLEGVVDGGDQEDEIGDECGEAVEDKFLRRELAAGERVRCSFVSLSILVVP